MPLVSLLVMLWSSQLSFGAAAPTPSIYKLPEKAFFFGQAKFLGVTPPQVPAPPPAATTAAGAGASSAGSRPDLRDAVVKSDPAEAMNRKQMKKASSGARGPDAIQLAVTPGKPDVAFNGVNMFLEKWSGVGPVYGGTQYYLTPPDVSLCAGNGFIVQPVNTAMAVYDTTGKLIAGVLALDQFFGLDPEFIRFPNGSFVTGDTLSDTQCVYDKDTKRFFLSSFWRPGQTSALDRFGQARVDPDTGERYGTGIILAVSGPDPTGPWQAYFIPGTNDGINSNNDTAPPLNYPSSAFLQDYPQISVDAFGVYITADQFSYSIQDFSGANVYAFPKKRLCSGTPEVPGVRFAMPHTTESSQNFIAFFIQPAKVPADGQYDIRNLGTAYFGSVVFSTTSETRSGLALWTLSQTATLLLPNPSIQLDVVLVDSPEYTLPLPGVPQKPGPIPVGKSLSPDNVVPNVDSDGGFKLQGCAWAGGKVWYTFSTLYGDQNLTGTVVAAVQPPGRDAAVPQGGIPKVPLRGQDAPANDVKQPKLVVFETFGVAGNHIIFPSISLNRHGKGLLAFALVGPDYYPTAAYAYIDASGALGSSVLVAGKGVQPLDVFDAYNNSPEYPGILRYGDWQCVIIDEKGDAWNAVEYVSGEGNTTLGNWATYIFKVKL